MSLFDLYKHVHRALWPCFYRVISDALSPCGALVLTMPTPLTQDYMASQQPDAFQLVDETMYWEDATRLGLGTGELPAVSTTTWPQTAIGFTAMTTGRCEWPLLVGPFLAVAVPNYVTNSVYTASYV